MTVTTDLALQQGVRRRLFARIDGLRSALWDFADAAPSASTWGSATWGSSVWGDAGDGVCCLYPPKGELGFGLSIGDMVVTPPSLTVELENVLDPDSPSTYLFAKLFAPGRHARTDSRTAHLALQGSSRYLSATSSTIVTNQDLTAAGWPSSGTAYLGLETFTYTGIGGAGNTSFTGCARGVYPVRDYGAWAQTHKVATDSSTTTSTMVSSVPFTWIGRRIALYCVTWDTTTGTWVDASAAKLLWHGRIASLRWNGARGTWELGCEHAMADLEVEMGSVMPSSRFEGINLSGSVGMSCLFDESYLSGGAWTTGRRLTAPITPYCYDNHKTVADRISSALNTAAGWSGSGTDVAYSLEMRDGKYSLKAWALNQDVWVVLSIGKSVSYASDGSTTAGSTWACHPFFALGFKPSFSSVLCKEGEFTVLASADDEPFDAYHPLSPACNGGRLLVDATTDFWTSQGDYGSASATVAVDKAKIYGRDEEITYVTRYSAKGTSYVGTNRFSGGMFQEELWPSLTIRTSDEDYSEWPTWSYVGWRNSDEDNVVRQIYSPHVTSSSGTVRGPFELLLYPLLSTGSSGYSHATYDAVPYEFCAKMDSSIVDTQSFLDADAAILSNSLAHRHSYVIDKPVSWMELLKRESQLFGYVLAWDAAQSKFSLRNVFSHDIQGQVTTLDDGNNCCERGECERPDADTSSDTVVNQWQCKVNFDPYRGRWDGIVTIDDEDSQANLRVVKTVKIEHPGVSVQATSSDTVDALLRQLLLQQQDMFRYPWQVVTRTLAPQLIGTISVGDVVSFSSSYIPDPYGSGAMGVSCLAVVLNVTWDLSTWTGKATLLLYSQYSSALKTPWAGAALTDKSATGGGWNATSKVLTLVAKEWGVTADSHDGAWITAGDIVDVVERAPADPLAPQRWTDITVATGYNSSDRTIVLTTTTLSGWNASLEYIVLPAFYAGAAAAQLTQHTWQANATTLLLGASATAQRYG